MVTIKTTFNGLDKLEYKNSIITIGSFDGVHLGHKKIFDEMASISKQCTYKNHTILITFDPHPVSILKKRDKSRYFLSDNIDEKLLTLEKYNVDIVIVLKFDESISKISAKDFFDKIILSFSPIDVVMGHDNGFGHKREGDIKFISNNYKNINIHTISPEKNIENQKISSTYIRKEITNGTLKNANEMLGNPYSLLGTVVRGRGYGKTIDFPTINLRPTNESKIIPKIGVYHVKVEINDIEYFGMCNIGFSPTVTNNKEETIEIHIFRVESNVDFYDYDVKVYFLEFLREEKKFKKVELLVKQLNEDKKYCLSK